MDNGRDVFVLSGTRTPIGDYGGGLTAVAARDLAPPWCARRSAGPALSRPKSGTSVFGNVIHTDAHDMYLAPRGGGQGRPAGRDAGASRSTGCAAAACRRSSPPPR